MEQRNHIPVLALLGLSFTSCTGGDDQPNPIVGEWNAVQLDGEKQPELYSYGPYTSVYGLRITVEEDLAGVLAYYYVLEYGDVEYHQSIGSELVVDDSEAPKYRLEVARDLFDQGDYYNSVGYDSVGYDSVGTTAVSSDGDYGDYVGDGDGRVPTRALAAPVRPAPAPADLVLTCTLEQDTLTCAAEDGSPMSAVFKRKKPVEDEAD